MWPEDFEIAFPVVSSTQHLEIKINRDLPYFVNLPGTGTVDATDTESRGEPPPSPKKPSHKNSGEKSHRTEVIKKKEAKKNNGKLVAVFDDFIQLTDEEKLQKCEHWQSPFIIGRRGLLLCYEKTDHRGQMDFQYSDLSGFSSVIPARINRANLLSFIDAVETVIIPRLAFFFIVLFLGILWFFFIFLFIYFMGVLSLFFSVVSFFAISIVHVVLPQFPFTFGEILQFCTHGISLPMLLHGRISSDNVGYLVMLVLIMYSIRTTNRNVNSGNRNSRR